MMMIVKISKCGHSRGAWINYLRPMVGSEIQGIRLLKCQQVWAQCLNPGSVPASVAMIIQEGFDEHNPALEDRVPSNFPVPHGQSTPRPLTTGLPRNEGTVPGFGDAMPLSIPFIDTSDQGEGQQQSFPISMPVRAPLLPLGPHPSLLSPGGSYQQSHHMPQMQPPPSHFLPHSHLSCPSPMAVPQLPPTPGQMGMQSSTSRRVPAMPQGHMMSMNLMHSGWEPANALQQPPHGGYANGIPTIQGPSDPALSRSIQPQTTCSNVNGSST
ncbi:hypothetical protein C5167_050302 [Papaver somniferum]|uniref:Uncharacterized protein n=1 Tax=Papaver somniferum TaxID=3469 RepID=A0A4Y7KNA1_PAPSO|nr:hypothetical protein C5167_050302 [Papaver somniferum]